MKIDIRQVAYKPAEQGMAGQSNSPPPQNFLKPVCGISVVKREITPVFTEVISLLVDLKGIEPSNLTDAKRFRKLFWLVSTLFGRFHWISLYL